MADTTNDLFESVARAAYDSDAFAYVDSVSRASGFDPNVRNARGRSLLAEACQYSSARVVDVLLAAGADPNCIEPLNKTPLGIAAGRGDVESLRLLLARGAKPNSIRDASVPPLWLAAQCSQNSSIDCIHELLDAGADPNLPARDRSGEQTTSPLMIASANGNVANMHALITAGANVDFVGPDGTALSQAAEAGKIEAAKVLLDAGANVHLTRPESPDDPLSGKSPLEIAKAKKRKAMITLLESAMSLEQRPEPADSAALTIKDIWERIRIGLRKRGLLRSSRLRPAADQDQLSTAESKLNLRFPAEFHESYCTFDGQQEDGKAFIPPPSLDEFDSPFQWFSLEQMIAEWSNWTAMAEQSETHRSTRADPGISPHWFHPGWIPFAGDGTGDLICLDLAPTEGGRVGQILFVDHENGTRQLLAPSFRDWLETLADQILDPSIPLTGLE